MIFKEGDYIYNAFLSVVGIVRAHNTLNGTVNWITEDGRYTGSNPIYLRLYCNKHKNTTCPCLRRE